MGVPANFFAITAESCARGGKAVVRDTRRPSLDSGALNGMAGMLLSQERSGALGRERGVEEFLDGELTRLEGQ